MTQTQSPDPSDLSLQDARERDAASPLRGTRERFAVPEGTIYLDGNSLGALPRTVADRLATTAREEWGQGLISSWNAADWIHLPQRVGDKIAALVGAGPDTVHVGDSTSVTLFKAMVAACRLRPDRHTLVVEPTTFPTDGYVAQGVAELLGLQLRWGDPADPAASLDDDVALLALTHVDFRSGAMYDMAALTRAAHDAGALMLWDLCHSAGAVPVDLAGHDVDLAVGCTYKYLNAGPGSPAYLYVAPRLVDRMRQPIPGWMGHATPFEMQREHAPAPGVRRFASGTPPVLALSALDAALDAFDGVDLTDLRAASLSLTDFFIARVEAELPGVFEVITPADHSLRGSQVSLRHDEAYGVVQALIARGVIGDFRTPDVARFGFAPLYVTHVDVHRAVDQLAAVLAGEEHRREEYAVRNLVT